MRLWALAIVAAVLMAGCSKAPAETGDDVLPAQITQRSVEQLESVASETYPRAFAFPGQSVLPRLLTFLNGTLSPGEGIASVETPDDDGPLEVNPMYITMDLKEFVPEGQPVEIRLGLKWWGDPGAGADLDIYADVPGVQDAYDGTAYNWAWNWNIVNKARVVNTVHLADEPLLVGIQVADGRVFHPEGMDYSLKVELAFPPRDVLPPRQPFGLTLADGATGFIIESEPVTGDEHITTEMVILSPEGRLHRAIVHNDIGTETLFIPATRPGEYIFYVAAQDGGFVRIESDIQNPSFEARPLKATETLVPVMSGAIMAPAAPGENSYGAEGEMALEGPHPLDLYGYVSAVQGQSLVGELQFDILSDAGVVHSLLLAGPSSQGDIGRIGERTASVSARDQMTDGLYTWGLRGNLGAGAEVGYVVVGYEG